MDNHNIPSQPDLAAILRTLSQYQKPAQATKEDGSSCTPANANRSRKDEIEEYDPTHFIPITEEATPQTSIQSTSARLSSVDHPPPSQASTTPTSTPPAVSSAKISTSSVKDPSQITTWAAALRHVTALVARDPNTLQHLRKLRRSQQEHEQLWWKGRQALLKTQDGRSAGRAQIEAILKGVGGSVDSTVQGPTPADDADELATYDRKVYQAVIQMERSMKGDLKGMGIPFFCTEPGLVVESGDEKQEDGSVSSEELRLLQLRMIEMLEDLSGE
jgi:hypothetical protein